MKSRQIQEFKETEIGKIPVDWKVIEFSKISEFSYGKMPQKNDIVEKGYPIFSGYRIVGYHKKFMYEDEKLIIVARGVGGTGDIKLSPPKSYITNLSIIANLNKNLVDKRFLYYYFFKGLRYLDSGSAQSQITINDLNRVKISLPPILEQSSIGKIFTDIDFKIEALQKINKILEQIIQSIFKSWFIDFNGVTEFEDSELGQIPKGWQVGTFADVIEEIESGKRPKGGINSLDTEIPSIGAENIIGLGRYDYSKTKYVSLKFFNEMKTGRIKDNDVLLYKDGASLGRKSLFRNDFPFKQCCINEHVFILRPNKKISSTFLFFWLDQNWMEENVRNLNSNSAQPGINKPGVLSLPILIPEIYTINSFQRLVEPIIIKIFKNSILIQSLTKTRDVLLPKLMSGEIRV